MNKKIKYSVILSIVTGLIINGLLIDSKFLVVFPLSTIISFLVFYFLLEHFEKNIPVPTVEVTDINLALKQQELNLVKQFNEEKTVLQTKFTEDKEKLVGDFTKEKEELNKKIADISVKVTELEGDKKKFDVTLNKTLQEKLFEQSEEFSELLQNLKDTFKEREKQIKKKSVSSSRRTLIGKFIEKFVPFANNNPYSPADMQFLGQPIDYIVFDGMKDNKVKKIVFLEVKSGDSELSARQKSVKKAVEDGMVFFKEHRMDVPDEKEEVDISSDEEASDDIYDDIDQKIKGYEQKAQKYQEEIENLEEDDIDDEDFEDDELEFSDVFPFDFEVTCTKCFEVVDIELNSIDDYHNLNVVRYECPECKGHFLVSPDEVEEIKEYIGVSDE